MSTPSRHPLQPVIDYVKAKDAEWTAADGKVDYQPFVDAILDHVRSHPDEWHPVKDEWNDERKRARCTIALDPGDRPQSVDLERGHGARIGVQERGVCNVGRGHGDEIE
jgi:hypothetical protein